jgi:hypothetical protein
MEVSQAPVEVVGLAAKCVLACQRNDHLGVQFYLNIDTKEIYKIKTGLSWLPQWDDLPCVNVRDLFNISFDELELIDGDLGSATEVAQRLKKVIEYSRSEFYAAPSWYHKNSTPLEVVEASDNEVGYSTRRK